MANSKSADKRARQNKKRYELKHAQRSMVRTAIKATVKAVEEKDPNASKRIKQLLSSSENQSEMRYLEGLLLMLGESPGELEDAPDYEDDQEEYWEEY